jgi:ribosomal protein L37AE/L43A
MRKRKTMIPKDQHQPGVCPFCGSGDLDYQAARCGECPAIELDDGAMLWLWTCGSCYKSGKEVMHTKFLYHIPVEE